jgi:hypothetical protein
MLASWSLQQRGSARVTNESRSFDQDGHAVMVDAGQITIVSTLNYSEAIDGENVQLPLSTVTLVFDQPASAGTFDLTTLHAKVCEDVQDTWTPACGAVAGTLTYSPGDKQKLDGDLVLTAATHSADDPTLTGSAHFHYEVNESTDWCPDLGGPSGVFAPE